jgi:hypothetical protein
MVENGDCEMDQALANALKRRKELEDELRRLNQFIHMYHELAGTSGIGEIMDAEIPAGNVVAEEGGNRLSGLIRPRGRPADFAQIIETVLKEVGRPLQRGQLVEEVEKRGHMIPSADKPRYLGTIIWRNNETFASIEGRGYWLVGVPVPPDDSDPDLLGVAAERATRHG